MTQQGKQSMASRIEAKLRSAFIPEYLQVVDESHEHAGHVGHAGSTGDGGETHFRVKIVAQSFAGKSRLMRHRAVNELLTEELAGGVHALALQIRAPGE
jgi:BolA protein